jgi:geranylgeranyl diphosphate synthase type II
MVAARMAETRLDKEPRGLYEPIEYCLKNGGKRIRPLMTLLGCEMFGGRAEEALSPAIGLELFHNFTLMHDDIMDQAPIRRGQPAVHVKWDTNTAILSGDVLFARAYEYMLDVPDHCLRQVMELFSRTVIEVCEGQQYDMDFEKTGRVTEAEYLEMIRLKTAVLPAACLKAGAIVAGAPAVDAEKIYRFGESVGLAFQLRDDWLDAFGDEALFGKKSGGDIVANKKTWLYIKAWELSAPAQRQELDRAYSGAISDPDTKIGRVMGIFNSLGIRELAIQAMETHYQRAFEALDAIEAPAGPKENLRMLAQSLFDRAH